MSFSDSLKNLKPEEVQRLEVLSKIGKKINTPEKFSEALRAVLDSVVDTLEAERGGLFLSKTGNEYPTLALFVDHSEEGGEQEFRHSTTVVEKVWHEEQPLAEVDTRDNELLADLNSIQAEGIRSVICVPLKGRLSKLGVLYLDNTISRAFTMADLQMLDVIADLASTALERARFFEDLQQLNDDLEARVESRTQEAESARLEAERATRAKSLFLAKMSHELRTPLNGILGLTEDLATREDNPALKLQLEQVVDSARSLATMINGVLDFSKLESEQVVIDAHEFVLEDAVVESLATINYEASKKGLELQVWIDETCPLEVIGDSIRLKQILINLLSNAVKFTPHGWVRLIASSPKPGRIAFAVTDSGVGIPQSKQVDIFKPFSQADVSTTREFGGTGLGLSICRSLCKLLGGVLKLESKVGEGSRFSFELPMTTHRSFEAPQFQGLPVSVKVASFPQQQALERVVKGWDCKVCSPSEAEIRIVDSPMLTPEPKSTVVLLEPGQQMESNLAPQPHHRHLLKPVTRSALLKVMKELREPSAEAVAQVDAESPESLPAGGLVLVAEDHEINRLVVQRMLENWGYQCVFAESGSEALERFNEQRPRLVLMDIEMPGRDGFETSRLLRSSEPRGEHVPIIAVTAHLAKDLRQRCLASGMDDLLSKPLSRQTLESRLRRWEGVLSGQLSVDQVRHQDFDELSQWPSRFLSPLNSLLSTLALQVESAPSHELHESLYRLETLAFSADLKDWGGRLAALSLQTFDRAKAQELIESMQQEWRDLAPSLVSKST